MEKTENMNLQQDEKHYSAKRPIVLVCLVLFLSLFAFENFHQVLLEETQVEISDQETESEKENENSSQDKVSKDKFSASDKSMAFKQHVISEYQKILVRKAKQPTGDVISPPPEA